MGEREERLTGVYDKLTPLTATGGDSGRFLDQQYGSASQNQAQRQADGDVLFGEP